MIAFGFAEAAGRPPNLRYREVIAHLERDASREGRGLGMPL